MPESPEEMALRVKMRQMYEATERIMEAVAPEKLRNNPYKGKPLDLSVNPFEKERALGHRMLKSSGFAPEWIETKRELLREQRAIRKMIDDYVEEAKRRKDAAAQVVRPEEKRRKDGAARVVRSEAKQGEEAVRKARAVARPGGDAARDRVNPAGLTDAVDDPLDRRFLEHVHERVARLRKNIELYNLKTPLMDQQLMNVRPEEWVAEAQRRLRLGD